MARKMNTKKSSKKFKKSKRKQKSSKAMPSTMSPTKTEQVLNLPQVQRKTPVLPGVTKKAQCDLCKLSYSTEKELSEHLLSIMHHTKMEDKEENPVHICTLCQVTCPSMATYRAHVTSDTHQQMLLFFKGDTDNISQFIDKRPYSQTEEQRNAVPTGGKTLSNDNSQTQKQGGTIQYISKWTVGGQNYNNTYFKFNGNTPSQKLNEGFWNGKHLNGAHHWSRDRVNQNYNQQYGGQYVGERAGLLRSQHRGNYYEPWGSGIYGDYHGYDRTTDVSLPFWGEGGGGRGRMNYGNHDAAAARLNYPNFKAAVSCPTIPEAWDEQLLLQQEQFVAGMDDGQFSSKQRPHPASSVRQKQYNTYNRRWANDGYGVQETLARNSGVGCVSSNQSASALQVETIHESDISEAQTKSGSMLSPNSRKLNCNQDSNTLNRLKPEEILKAKNKLVSLKKKIKSDFDKKEHFRVSLKRKTDADFDKKGHKNCFGKDSERSHSAKESIPEVSSSTSLQPNCASSAHSIPSGLFTASAHSQKKTISNTLDDIRKSIEKNVLDNEEEIQTKMKSTAPPKSKRIRCSSGGTTPVGASDSTTAGTSRAVPKLCYKGQLDRDSLKKIINAPHSRDERLQLARMLQSRDGQKTGTASVPLRTNLQLEGLHDSAVVASDVNLKAGQNCDVQTIKLEDLSDSARLQILDLIGHDMSSHFQSQIETKAGNKSPVDKLIKEKSCSQEDVIVLSDDENVKKKSKHKKKTPQTDSNTSTIKETLGVKKTKKRKLISETSLIEAPSICVQEYSGVSKQQSSAVKKSDVDRSTKKKSSKKKNKKCLGTDNPVEIVSCSLDVELGEKSKKSSKKMKKTDLGTDNPVEVVSCSLDVGLGDKSKKSSKKKKKTDLGTDNPVEIVSCSSDIELGDKSKKEKKVKHNLTETTLTKTVYSRAVPSSTKEDIPGSAELEKEQTPSAPNSSTDSPATRIESMLAANKNGKGGSSLLSPSKQPFQNMSDHLLGSSHEQTDPQTSPLHVDTAMRLDMEVQSTSPQRNKKTSSLHRTEPLSPEEVTRPSRPVSDSLSIAETKKSTGKSTESLPTAHTSSSTDKQLPNRPTLPPSTWLKDRQPPPSNDNCGNISRPASVEPKLFLPFVKDTKTEDGSGVATVITDDEDGCAVDSEPLSNNQMNCATYTVTDESSSRVMSELLVLSEREENVKQEKMSLDLRLNRLHKLLEQAVVQINQCTERRQQLHKEEQELSHQRMSLLRAILSTQDSSNPSSRCDSKDNLHPDSASISTPDAPSLTSLPFFETSSEVASSGKHPQGTSLSRADWLAKFSSFLPRDPSRGSLVAGALSKALPAASSSELGEHIHHSSTQLSSLSLSLSSDVLVGEKGALPSLRTLNLAAATHDSLHCQVSSDEEGSSEAPPAATVPVSSNLKAAPIMYLGSFKRSGAHAGANIINLK